MSRPIIITLALVLSLCLGLALLLVYVGGETMIVDQYDPLRHERFAGGGRRFIASRAVAGIPLHLSGVARAANGFWATMISDTHFVSVNHAQPAGRIVFYHTNDVRGPTTERTVTDGVQIEDTDIWIGRLNSPIDPSRVTVYPIAKDGDYVGQIVYHVGRGPRYGVHYTTSFRVGRNKISGIELRAMVDEGRTDSLIYFDDSREGDLSNSKQQAGLEWIPDETYLQSGDSGGPSFIRAADGTWILVGVHSFIAERLYRLGVEIRKRRVSGDAYLPAYRALIRAATTGQQPSARNAHVTDRLLSTRNGISPDLSAAHRQDRSVVLD